MGSRPVRKNKQTNYEMYQKYTRKKRRNRSYSLLITKEPAVPENDPIEEPWELNFPEEAFGSEQQGNLLQDIRDLISHTFRRATQ